MKERREEKEGRVGRGEESRMGRGGERRAELGGEGRGEESGAGRGGGKVTAYHREYERSPLFSPSGVITHHPEVMS